MHLAAHRLSRWSVAWPPTRSAGAKYHSTDAILDRVGGPIGQPSNRGVFADPQRARHLCRGEATMRIGIIGSGNIGGTAARLLVNAGHEVALSHASGPASLRDQVEIGRASCRERV